MSLTAQQARELQDPKLEQALTNILQQVQQAALQGFDQIQAQESMPRRLQQQLRALGYEVVDYGGKLPGQVAWHSEPKEPPGMWVV